MAKNETTFRHILFGMILCDIFLSWFQNMSERHMFQHNLTSFFNVSCGNFRKTLRIYVCKIYFGHKKFNHFPGPWKYFRRFSACCWKFSGYHRKEYLGQCHVATHSKIINFNILLGNVHEMPWCNGYL